MEIPKNIIISRTDSVGDMVLALPMAGLLKRHFPEMTIGYMGTPYTRPVIEACSNIDTYVDQLEFMANPTLLSGESPQCIVHVRPRPELAKRAKELKIPYRIGTTNRIFHWLTCNKLVRLSRRNSDLHEAQLNLKLLEPFGIKCDLTLPEIANLYGFDKLQKLPEQFSALLNPNKFNLILHPKSRGSGREWPLSHYISLVEMLDTDKYQIFVSGMESEKDVVQPLFDKVGDRVTNIVGKMTLSEFIAFVAACDALVASGTGPVHIAAALQKHTLGIYPPLRPIHPGRWQPIGKKVKVFVLNKDCNDCRQDKTRCACTFAIQPLEIKNYLESIYSTCQR